MVNRRHHLRDCVWCEVTSIPDRLEPAHRDLGISEWNLATLAVPENDGRNIERICIDNKMQIFAIAVLKMIDLCPFYVVNFNADAALSNRLTLQLKSLKRLTVSV